VLNDSDLMATAAANDSTDAALAAAEAAERSANIAQNSVDLIAALSENIDIYISELKSQIASLERLISIIKTKMGII
jgi:tRNA1(Val) A37 N6-methylase TrmN6